MCVLENVHHKKITPKKKFNLFTNNVLTFFVFEELYMRIGMSSCIKHVPLPAIPTIINIKSLFTVLFMLKTQVYIMIFFSSENIEQFSTKHKIHPSFVRENVIRMLFIFIKVYMYMNIKVLFHIHAGIALQTLCQHT